MRRRQRCRCRDPQRPFLYDDRSRRVRAAQRHGPLAVLREAIRTADRHRQLVVRAVRGRADGGFRVVVRVDLRRPELDTALVDGDSSHGIWRDALQCRDDRICEIDAQGVCAGRRRIAEGVRRADDERRGGDLAGNLAVVCGTVPSEDHEVVGTHLGGTDDSQRHGRVTANERTGKIQDDAVCAGARFDPMVLARAVEVEVAVDGRRHAAVVLVDSPRVPAHVVRGELHISQMERAGL